MLKLDSEIRNILITGGSGFIGTNLVKKILNETQINIFNLDKKEIKLDTNLNEISISQNCDIKRYNYLKVNLSEFEKTQLAMQKSNPDLIIHLAAESHVDRSILNPFSFIESNIIGTYNILNASLLHWKRLSKNRKSKFRFYHISTDEVYGSLNSNEFASENSKYIPNSPYSASKASSDHLVNAWHKTYGLPIITSHCSNNYGPWQFPEKLIPLVIQKALRLEPIPIYGNGENIRDWLYVEDHIEAILLIASYGEIGNTYCIGGNNEKTNIEVVKEICAKLNLIKPSKSKYEELINYVEDRPGHDMRYAIDSTKLKKELGWSPKYKFEDGISHTINWYLQNSDWCKIVLKESNYSCERLGLIES